MPKYDTLRKSITYKTFQKFLADSKAIFSTRYVQICELPSVLPTLRLIVRSRWQPSSSPSVYPFYGPTVLSYRSLHCEVKGVSNDGCDKASVAFQTRA